MITNSNYPLYYPDYDKYEFSSILTRYEFELNSTFYIDELIAFSDILSNITYKETNQSMIILDEFKEGKFWKNGSLIYYSKYLIPFYTSSTDPSYNEHLMSLIFCYTKESYTSYFTEISDGLISRLYVQTLLFFIMGAILLLIARYLIVSIALNIVKPIKNLKNMIQGMNTKKPDSNEKQLEQKQSNEENENEDDGDDDDDDYLETRSEEIDTLFDTLLKLKRVLNFTTNPTLNNNKSALVGFVNAKYIFKSVNNHDGETICSSNLGNLALKCQKYDKAIFHILESLNKDTQNEKEIEYLNKSRKSKPRKSKNSIQNKPALLDQDETKGLIKSSHRSLTLEKRYPKLLYAYKKFFSNLNKIIQNEEELFDEVAKNDYFVLKDKHSLSNYEEALISYINESEKANDHRRMAEGYLEYNEFLIKYYIKMTENELKIIEEDNEIEKKEKSEEIHLIEKKENPKKIKLINDKREKLEIVFKNFKLYEEIYEEKLSKDTNNESIRNFLELMQTSKRDTIDMIEVPIFVLRQKSKYLRGKLAYYCEDYEEALGYLLESKEIGLISDALYMRKSLKLVKKIVINVKSHFEKSPDTKINSQNQIELKDKEQDPNKDKISCLDKFLEEIETELNKFTLVSRDIIVLIDISDSMSVDEKKIDKVVNNSINLFENFITTEDRFGLFFSGKSTNSIINLDYKNSHTYSYMKELLEDLKSTIYNYKEEYVRSNLIKSLMKIYEYMKKKSYRNREKWVIIFSDSFNPIQENYHLLEISKFFQNNDQLFKVAFIGINMNSEDKIRAKEFFTFNKSCYLDFDEISELKFHLKIMGKIQNDINFQNENYDADRKYY